MKFLKLNTFMYFSALFMAQIGAENSETTANESKTESNSDEESSSWWNPLSWF